MIGPMGSPTVLAAQDILFDAGVLQLFPLTAAEFTFKFDPASQERLKFNNILPYVESTRAALKYMMEWKKFASATVSCIRTTSSAKACSTASMSSLGP